MFVEYIELVHAEQSELFSKGTLLYNISPWRSPRRGAVLETAGKVDITIQLNELMEDQGGGQGLCPWTHHEANVYSSLRHVAPTQVVLQGSVGYFRGVASEEG